VHYNPQYLQVIAAAASVIVARYTMHLGDAQVGATVMLPASAVVDRLAESGSLAVPGHAAGRTVDQVRAAPVDVTLRLAPLSIGAGDVLDLVPGDLLRLPHPETKPFELVLGTTPIARATTGARGSRLACTITDIHEETS
jgi:flagellar motor switch protein FliM